MSESAEALSPIDRLLAYEEIRQLASAYGVYSDARDLDKLISLYISDVRVGRDTYGHEALRENFDQAFRGVGITFLMVGNHVIDLIDADHATGIVYCRGEIQDGGIDSDRFIIHAIQYHDTYERQDGRWLFVRRKHFLVYGAELGVNPLTLAPAEWPKSQTGLGSHPHTLESWQAFWGKTAIEAANAKLRPTSK